MLFYTTYTPCAHARFLSGMLSHHLPVTAGRQLRYMTATPYQVYLFHGHCKHIFTLVAYTAASCDNSMIYDK